MKMNQLSPPVIQAAKFGGIYLGMQYLLPDGNPLVKALVSTGIYYVVDRVISSNMKKECSCDDKPAKSILTIDEKLRDAIFLAQQKTLAGISDEEKELLLRTIKSNIQQREQLNPIFPVPPGFGDDVRPVAREQDVHRLGSPDEVKRLE